MLARLPSTSATTVRRPPRPRPCLAGGIPRPHAFRRRYGLRSCPRTDGFEDDATPEGGRFGGPDLVIRSGEAVDVDRPGGGGQAEQCSCGAARTRTASKAAETTLTVAGSSSNARPPRLRLRRTRGAGRAARRSATGRASPNGRRFAAPAAAGPRSREPAARTAPSPTLLGIGAVRGGTGIEGVEGKRAQRCQRRLTAPGHPGPGGSRPGRLPPGRQGGRVRPPHHRPLTESFRRPPARRGRPPDAVARASRHTGTGPHTTAG